MIQTEFAFELPKGYLDDGGNLHRKGVMRLSRAIDEIVPLRDPRVKMNPAYATVIILSRVITKLGAIDEVSPVIIEGLFACDLSYLQRFYRQINELEDPSIATPAAPPPPSVTQAAPNPAPKPPAPRQTPPNPSIAKRTGQGVTLTNPMFQ